eukprot:jgi/Mesvir1/12866/Mv05892-RA.1
MTDPSKQPSAVSKPGGGITPRALVRCRLNTQGGGDMQRGLVHACTGTWTTAGNAEESGICAEQLPALQHCSVGGAEIQTQQRVILSPKDLLSSFTSGLGACLLADRMLPDACPSLHTLAWCPKHANHYGDPPPIVRSASISPCVSAYLSLPVVASQSPPKKLNTTSLRLSNNYISNYDGMEAAIAAIMDDPSKLMWLDLSQNKLETIGNVLTSYPELSTLYLHGNAIRSLKEVEKLGKLPNLVKLTLNGNPIEELPNYRLFVFAMVPTLRTLDFIPITKVDRDRADTWLQQHSRRAMYKH